ncbi:MAG: ABC transporter ATP-binding protein [Alphaproteobacteria bacterium]|nr:ABC transporter ATP-binding protein [Alphaproteobacteria bacterium]
MIEVESLRFQYAGATSRAVDDVSFTVGPGQVFGFLGPSGAGKSTVQKILIKLLPLQQGAVRYDGAALPGLGRGFFEQVGVSFEHPNLFPKLTGRENLTAFAGLYANAPVDIDALMARVGLGDARDRLAGAYSKGMKQRLVFCRALLHQPRFLFLDEPTSGLDPATAQVIMDVIREQRDRGAAVLLTTHNMAVADALCEELVLLNDGRVVARGSPRDLKLAHGQRLIRVEWRAGGDLRTETLSLDLDADHARLKELLDGGAVETVHSQEATLEQVFIKLTGRGLS